MEYLKLNKSRHAVKHFDGSRIPTVDVKQIISTAALAPSAHNIQPWLFTIVESDDRREQLLKEMKSQKNVDQVAGAGAVIVLFSDTQLATRAQEIARAVGGELGSERLDQFNNRYPAMFDDYEHQYASDYLALNTGLVAMNLVLAIKDYGYESNIILGFNKTSRVNEALGVPLRYRPELIIPLGKSEEKGQPHVGLPQGMLIKIV